MMTQSYESRLRDQNNNNSEMLDYLIRRFSKQVLKLAYYHVRDRHLAEDICQEAFLRVFKNLERFRQDSSYYTWIYRITVNLCRDYKASAYFRKMIPSCRINTNAVSETKLFEEVEGGEVFSKVMDLPVKYRVVIGLYYFEGYTTAEIAGILKIKESTVRSRLSRGRDKLRKNFTVEGSL